MGRTPCWKIKYPSPCKAKLKFHICCVFSSYPMHFIPKTNLKFIKDLFLTDLWMKYYTCKNHSFVCKSQNKCVCKFHILSIWECYLRFWVFFFKVVLPILISHDTLWKFVKYKVKQQMLFVNITHNHQTQLYIWINFIK